MAINDVKGFWKYAHEKSIKNHGVSKGRSPMLRKEINFRDNHRDKPLCNLDVDYLTNFMPDLL